MSETALHGPDVDRPFPPVAWFSTAALACVIIGGILMASSAPHVAPLAAPTALLCVGAALLASSVTMLARVTDFSWPTFRKVFKWTVLVYVVFAGMIELAFVRDHMRGASLVIVTLMLVIFALSVPINIAFTTARYADVG